MDPAIIVSLITLVGSALGTFAGIALNIKLTNYRLEKLEEKVEKHNTIVERTYKLEEQTALQGEKIKVINHRIQDLEEKENN